MIDKTTLELAEKGLLRGPFQIDYVAIDNKVIPCLVDSNGIIMTKEAIDKLLLSLQPFYANKNSAEFIRKENDKRFGIDFDKILEAVEKVK